MTAVRRLGAVYRVLLSSEIAATAAYRAQLVVGVLGWVVPLAMLALWRTAAGDEGIEGITGAQLTTYFVAVLVTTTANPTPTMIFGLGELVASGRLSSLLLRPAHPLHSLLARDIAETITRILPVAAVAATVIVVLDGAVSSDPTAWLLAIAVGLVGIVGAVHLGAIVGALALWMTKAAALQGVYFGVEWILGGLIAPIALLPEPLDAIARYQPLWFAVAAPGELVSGMSSVDQGVTALVVGVAWVIVLNVVFRNVWRRGMVRYEAVGS